MDDRRRIYKGGLCDAMALALGEMSGLPHALIGTARDLPPEEWVDGVPETEFVPGHAVVLVDEARQVWLDVDGLHEGLAGVELVTFGPSGRVEMRPVPEDEVRYAFLMEGVPEEHVVQARAFADADPLIQEALARIAAAPRF